MAAVASTVTVVVAVDDPAGRRRNRLLDDPDPRAAPGVNVMVRLNPAIVIDEPVTPETVPDATVTVLGADPAEPTVPPFRPPANRPPANRPLANRPPNPPGAPEPVEPPDEPAARSVQVPDAGAGVIVTLVALTVLGAVPDAPTPGVPVAVMHAPAVTAASDASTVWLNRVDEVHCTVVCDVALWTSIDEAPTWAIVPDTPGGAFAELDDTPLLLAAAEADVPALDVPPHAASATAPPATSTSGMRVLTRSEPPPVRPGPPARDRDLAPG